MSTLFEKNFRILLPQLLTHHCPVLCAVFGGGDAVQTAEGFQEAAVIRKAAFGAGIQDGNALFQRLAAVLHPQIDQVVVDTLHGALLERAGKVLPAGVKFLRQLHGGEGRVLIMGLKVGHRARDQHTGAAGCSGLSAAGGGDFYYEDNDSYRKYFRPFAEKYHFKGAFAGMMHP